MRVPRVLRWIAACVVVLAAGTACGGPEISVAAPDRGTVGIVMPTTKSPRWISDGKSMEQQFQLLGYKTDLKYAEDDVKRQISQIQAMIDAKVRALVIASVDGGALKDVLASAGAAQIPVIAYDRLIRDTPNVDYYATFDNFKVGVLQARYIVKRLGLPRSKGPFTIELFAGSPDDNNAGVFFNGSMSVLRPYLSSGTIRVLSDETDFKQVATMRWDGALAKQRMARLLRGPLNGKALDGVLSPYDGLSRGILEAVQADSGRQPPVITGQDAELDSVKLIASGKQAETVYKDTRELAKVAVQMASSRLSGGTPEVNDTKQYDNGVKVVPAFLLQPVDVDRTNYRRVLVDGGYYTADQLAG
ncbi:multiple monosaccharide ABC transporter substrate-binding protein [Nucisporomicrobium flavum]|uniref:multiple monosaccharide ABC transporter substrate-binding protein n=1 Tax=Nucisporomicrobium flavum TaxID=2785915 RepID=UPI0018F44754|nr:multiple monosaccharide ABC transporter substrate-binding protein [Nucisporomicrobium flavum]